MTVPATPRIAGPYIGNAAATSFAFGFKVFVRTDVQLVVYLADGSTVPTVLDSNYAVTLNPDQANSPGGAVTYPITGSPLPAGATLTIAGSLPYDQTLSLPGGGNFNPMAIERAFDRTEIQIQQILERQGRSLTLPLGEGAVTTFPPIASRANKLLGFDAQGKFIGVLPTAGDAVSLAIDLQNTGTPAKGAGQLGYDAALAYVGRTVGRKLRELVSVFDYIPVSEHAAIKAGNSTLDVSSYINAALAAAQTVYVPAGGYFTRRPINMSARRNGIGLFANRQLIGEGSGNSIINAYTGNYPILDRTGSSNCLLQGIAFRSDNPSYAAGLTAADCSSIGIMNRRGSTATLTQYCHYNRDVDVRINLTSAPARNGGTGTVGFIDCGGEHIESDNLQVYANVPYVAHNVLQFAVSNSSDIPTFGVEYEPPFAGTPISTSVIQNRLASLISYDAFRVIWLFQVTNIEFSTLYTSTRVLAGGAPAYAESFRINSCAGVTINGFQEVSGKTGATYRPDHAYLTIDGTNVNINIKMLRTAFDVGFPLAAVAAPSCALLNNVYIAGFDINCGNVIGDYDASVDNLGFPNEAISVTGTPNALRNGKFTFDSVFSRTNGNVFGTIGPWSANVDGVNHLSGASYHGSVRGTFTPTARGLTAAGVGTYLFQAGTYAKSGRTLTFTIALAWSGHTGTGGMQVAGLPFNSDANVEQAVSVYYDGLASIAGRQLVCKTTVNSGVLTLFVSDPGGGGVSGLAFDSVVASLIISGSIVIA